jgi:hypothetical protein
MIRRFVIPTVRYDVRQAARKTEALEALNSQADPADAPHDEEPRLALHAWLRAKKSGESLRIPAP